LVSESGIFKKEDLKALADAKVQARLIGESLIKQKTWDRPQGVAFLLSARILFRLTSATSAAPRSRKASSPIWSASALEAATLGRLRRTGDWHCGQPPIRAPSRPAKKRGVRLPACAGK